MDYSTPVFSFLHDCPKFAQIHANWVSDAIQPSHPLPPLSPFVFNLSQHQGLGNPEPDVKSVIFASGGQSIWVSSLASVLPVSIQGWFPLGLTGLISLQSRGLSRVFSNIKVWKHQFFGAQPSLWSNSHLYVTTGKTIALTRHIFVGKVMSLLCNMLHRFVSPLPGLLTVFCPLVKGAKDLSVVSLQVH